MQRTKSKILSILLSLVMLLSLLPTTALAATYYDRVKVNDILLENGHYLASNSSTSAETGANTEPTTYVAWYKGGVLTLKGYNGKGIETQGVAAGELTVKLIGTNSINNGSLVSDNGGNIIVTSDSGGTLSITKTISDSNNAAIGIETGLASSYTTGNVTIKGNAEVTINMTHNGTKGYDNAYGIYAEENITISENASVDITCATPNNNTINGNNCNGLVANKNVTIDTNGTIKIDVTNAGGDDAYSYGIRPTNGATLTKVGEMEVKWKKHASISRYSGGTISGSESFSDADHAINVDTTNCYASYRKGTPYTVTVVNGDLIGPGVPNKKGSGMFLVGDTVNITPYERKSNSDEVIPFKEWTAEGVTLTSSTTADTSFNVPTNDVTVTATYNPFDGAPVFTRTDDSSGTIAFQTAVKPDGGAEYFEYVKVGEENDPYGYRSIAPQPTTASTASSYEYSVSASNYFTGGDIKHLEAGDYRMAVTLSGKRYLSDPFTVNYTAASTGNYPIAVAVYNKSGNSIGLSDKQYLATNDATGASDGYTDGTSYVARYDKSNGTLYLKGYEGVATEIGIAAAGDLKIVVESNSNFTTTKTTTEDLMGIQASGKLNISGSGTLTVRATGKGNVYGIYAKEGVTISAPLAVTVGKNNTEETGPVYGIYTESGAISLSGADKTITATGGKDPAYGVYNAAQTSSAGSSNITISGKLTVSPSNGTSNYGIYTGSGSTITLNDAKVNIPGNFKIGIYNNNGNVVIKNKSDVTLTSDVSNSWGVYAKYGGDLIIENSTVSISTKGYAASLENGGLTIKNSTVDLTMDAETYLVVNTYHSATNTIDLSGSGSVTLTASGNQTGSMIGGTVSITTPGTKCVKGTYYDYGSSQNYDGEYDGSSKTVLQFVHEDPAPAANISLSETGTMDFGSMEEGYSTAPTAQTVTITNSGTAATGPLTITLEGTNAGSFTVSPTSITDIASGGDTDTFTVQPNTGLSAGTYTATVKVSGTGVTEQSFDVKFTVTAPATPITDMLVTVSDLTGKTYNESAQEPTFGGLIRDTDYTVSYAVKSGSTGTFNSDGKPVGAGTYIVTVTGIGSYTNSFTKDFEIGKATPVYTAPTAKTGLAYTGSALDLITAGSVSKGGEMQYKLDSGSYGTTIPTATNAGNYTVHFKIVEDDNYNAVPETQVGTGAINIAQVEWGTPTETLTPVNPTIAGGNNGQITGTTNAMQYKKSTESSWNNCTGDVTGLTAGTYYVRYKADSNHTASDMNYKTVTLTDPGTTLYGVTVTDGTASPSGNQAAGAEVTITANTKTGFNFKEWTGLADSDYKTGSNKTSNPATFVMPASAVNVTATYDPAALTGTVSITGDLKYGAELTATLTGDNNTGNLDYKWYQNGTIQVAANNTGKYTLRADDIGKTITVKVSSNVQTGEISGTTTGTIEKADSPAAPAAFTLSFTLNSDGTTYTATIPTVAGGEYSFDGTSYSTTNTKTDCAANTSYTGHVRIAETPTQKASASTSSTQTSPKLTVATPTFTPNGVSGFTGTQSVTISCATAGATIHYTTNGTAPTASSPVYSTPLSLTSTTTVKAIAVMTDMNDSAIATANFTKYSGGGGGGGGSSSGGSAATPSVSDKAAKELKNAKEGSTVTIDMKGETKLPASVTKEIAGKDVTVELDMGGGMVWSFNGLDVPKGGVRLDLGVKTGTKTIPAKAINALTGEATTIQLQLNHNGPFGMSLNLSVDLGKKHNGLYANLYFYNSKSGELEFQSAGMISGGKASWAFDHASDYAIVIDKESHEPMTFTDVPASAYYAEAVNWAVAKKITEGVGNDLFAPNQPCTRAQIVTFLWRAAGSPAPKNTGTAFGDVKSGSFYEQAVAWAVENGITGGTGDGKFSPDATCTRAQAVTFLYRASGAPAVSGNAAFSDVATNAYYADAVAWAAKNGITGGIGGGQFGSGNDCTRAQIVTFLYRNYQSK